jgi:integrase
MSHIRKQVLSSGEVRWQVRASTSAGCCRRYSARNFGTESEAKAWARTHGAAIEGKGISGGKGTVGGYFERWLGHLDEAGKHEAKTVYEYRHHLGRLVPLIGGIRLDRLTSYDLDQAYAQLLRRGGRGGAPLQPRTVYHVHRIASTALKRAAKWRLIAENPAASAEPPSPGKSPARAPTPSQLAAYVAAARTTPYWPIILTALALGLRRGEICGLAWRAVDFERGTLEVTQVMCEVGGRYWLRPKPKTAAGFRTIAMPPTLADELRRLQLQQKEERLAHGAAYRRDLDLVFALPGGEPWQPNRLSRKVAPIARAAGLPRNCWPLHSLRHRHASDMLAQGVPLKVASERLGHSSIAVTADIYSHVDAALDRGAAEATDRVLRALLTKPER